MMKFKLPKERKIDLTIISKESNITTNDIIDNFIESIIKENLSEVYEYLEQEAHQKLLESIRRCFTYNIKFGIIEIYRTKDFIYDFQKQDFTKFIFLCPICKKIYPLSKLEDNRKDDKRYQCQYCKNYFLIEHIVKFKEKYADLRINKFLSKCIEIRKRKNIRIYEIAERTGVSQTTIIGIEKGTQRPKINVLLKYLDTLGMNIEKLLEHCDDF